MTDIFLQTVSYLAYAVGTVGVCMGSYGCSPGCL